MYALPHIVRLMTTAPTHACSWRFTHHVVYVAFPNRVCPTQMLAKRGSVNMSHPLMMGDSARSRRSSAVSYPGPNSPELAQLQAAGMSSGGLGSGMYSMQSGGPQQQQSSSQGQPLLGGGGGYDPVQAGGQPAFQFTGGRPGGLMGSGLLPPDVGRTGSAPNLGKDTCRWLHRARCEPRRCKAASLR